MQPLVQSAIDAANRGENNKALEFCKQALAANPNDVDAWLVVAAVVDQPERKRQCLNRVLSLDPTNQIARDELFEMDRAAMGGTPPSASVSQPTRQPSASQSNYPTSTSAFEAAPAPERSPSIVSQVPAKAASKPSLKVEKPLAFRLPIWTRLSFYLVTVVAAVMMISAAITGELEVALGSFILFIMMLGLSLAYSFKIEVSNAGILVDRFITQARIGWNEISELKSGTAQNGLELKRKKGKSVTISGAVSNYSNVIEILRQKRPDLFGGSPTGERSRITFTETKVYKKSFLMQYGGILLGIPMLLFSGVTVLNGGEYFLTGILFAVLSLFLIFQPFFSASKIRIETNRVIFEMFFGDKEFPASEIEKIWIKTVRGRYGTAFQYVMVKPIHGRAISLRGLGVGEEVLYGVLMNWWSANNQQLGIKK